MWLLHQAPLSDQGCSAPGAAAVHQGRAVVQCSRCFQRTSPLKYDGTCMSSEPDQLVWCNTSEGDRSSPAHHKLN